MEYENYLMEILKEQFRYLLIDNYNVSENEVVNIDADEKGNMFKDDIFLRKYEQQIFTDELMNYIYDFLIQIDEGLDINRLVAFLSSHYYINHYDNEKDKPILKALANCSIEELVKLFYENGKFGKSILSSFYSNTAHNKKYNDNKELIKEDGNYYAVDRFINLVYPSDQYDIYTINQKLRRIICNIYNHYISNGYSDDDALSMTWRYFSHGIDPLNELDDICDDDYQIAYYKKYALGLIYGDLYENTANMSPIELTDYADVFAQLFPTASTIFGRSVVPQDPIVRNRMLKTFIMLQDDPERRRSNRERTFKEKRQRVLKKVNPFYILD